MKPAAGSKASLFASLFLGAALLACAFLFNVSVSSPPPDASTGIDLSGVWDFHNGPVEGGRTFQDQVEVPRPLPEHIRRNLAEEFWYRKEFSFPKEMAAREGAIFLGSIKGAHQVFWNGKFLGAGGKTGLAFYRIPPAFGSDRQVTLLVRVKKGEGLFPGIVSMKPILIGDANTLEKEVDLYYYDTGAQPLLSSMLKLALFFLFLGFYAAVPMKRECFSFSLFALFASLSSVFYSRFVPGYEDALFKNGMVFLFFVLSFGTLPALGADFLRLPERERSGLRIYGYSLALVFLSAALSLGVSPSRFALFRTANFYLPALAAIPVILFCIKSVFYSSAIPLQRKVQICAFAGFLSAGVFAWSAAASSFLQFGLFDFQEFLDLIICAGLGATIALDYRQTAVRSQRASRVVPKWFSGFLAGGMDRVVLEIPMVVMAVDTVGYTRQLLETPADRRDDLHGAIRAAIGELTGTLAAQKISERGDGGLFAWDLPGKTADRELVLATVLEAARTLARISSEGKIKFRIGMACGNVRGEMLGADISFLGEPLNCAARLETIAEPGCALVDESLSSLLPMGETESSWKEAELKGVLYRAKPLRVAA